MRPSLAQRQNLPDDRQLHQGILLMAAGTAIVPAMDAIAKHLGATMSPVQITCGRFLFQFIIMGLFMLVLRGPRALLPENPAVQALRGFLLASATLLFFTALRYLPLANAIAIFFVQPMILTIISAVFLHEHIGWHRRIAVITGFIGALFVIRPGGDTFTPASLLPLATALLFACYLALTRKVANRDHPATSQFASGLAAFLMLALALLILDLLPENSFAPSTPNLLEWLWLAAIGVIAALGHLLVVMAMNRAPASALAPFGYIEIVAASLLGWWFFQEWPDAWTWTGILIIVSSGIYVFAREKRNKKLPQASP